MPDADSAIAADPVQRNDIRLIFGTPPEDLDREQVVFRDGTTVADLWAMLADDGERERSDDEETVAPEVESSPLDAVTHQISTVIENIKAADLEIKKTEAQLSSLKSKQADHLSKLYSLFARLTTEQKEFITSSQKVVQYFDNKSKLAVKTQAATFRVRAKKLIRHTIANANAAQRSPTPSEKEEDYNDVIFGNSDDSTSVEIDDGDGNGNEDVEIAQPTSSEAAEDDRLAQELALRERLLARTKRPESGEPQQSTTTAPEAAPRKRPTIQEGIEEDVASKRPCLIPDTDENNPATNFRRFILDPSIEVDSALERFRYNVPSLSDLCYFESYGSCLDDACPYVHKRDCALSDQAVVEEVLQLIRDGGSSGRDCHPSAPGSGTDLSMEAIGLLQKMPLKVVIEHLRRQQTHARL